MGAISSSVASPNAIDSRRTFVQMLKTHDDDGYKVMMERQKAIKESSKKMLLYLQKQVKACEANASRLNSLAAELKYAIDHAKCQSTEQRSVEAKREEFREMARVYSECAQKIKTEVEQEFLALRLRFKKTMKEESLLHDRDNRNLNAARTQHQRTENQLARCRSDLSTLREQAGTRAGREAERLYQRTNDALAAEVAAEAKNKSADEHLRNTTLECKKNWAQSLVRFEDCERERMEFFRVKMANFCNIMRDLATRELESFTKQAKAFAAINADSDLEGFVRGTADCIPPDAFTGTSGTGSNTMSSDIGGIGNTLANATINSSISSSTSSYTAGAADGGRVSEAFSRSTRANNPASEASGNETHEQQPGQAAGGGGGGGGDEVDYMDPSVALPVLHNVIAIYDYDAQLTSELSFATGQTMQVLEELEGGWWLAEIRAPAEAGKPSKATRGLIPSNFVQIIP